MQGNLLKSGRLSLGQLEFGRGASHSWSAKAIRRVIPISIAAAVAVLGIAPYGLSQGYEAVPPLPAGTMPVPGAAAPQAPTSGQQYLIYVNDTSDTTLSQVRLVEPTAFRTTFQGRSVIQAGRFNMTGNAQQRVTDLSALGVTAEMAQVAAAVPYYAQTSALPNNVYASNGDLPPLPDAAFPQAPTTGVLVPALPPNVAQVPPAPGNVEFGQELNYGVPPAPSSGVAIPPPTGAPPVTESFSAPYYVVIPTAASNLGTLSSQVIQLGTPPDRVQQRESPRGPHIAVGPFTDRGLANRWNDFYHEAGLSNSRVFFQR
ncbi:hypothetical protein IQ273_17710 [Nodosilinea sp. LEGE 07298]|uniref:hypothetical protein n=1 Tax=Nodosilinea sp. LEGE 07298 TaxID=2777970 RepID=UPI0018819201|nr:hypothetical protein [Nodosilinea sp. LEGE 07298]MBE9111245.1 hypothetical protein [Nodosilinea sp. LEGE 07298]